MQQTLTFALLLVLAGAGFVTSRGDGNSLETATAVQATQLDPTELVDIRNVLESSTWQNHDGSTEIVYTGIETPPEGSQELIFFNTDVNMKDVVHLVGGCSKGMYEIEWNDLGFSVVQPYFYPEDTTIDDQSCDEIVGLATLRLDRRQQILITREDGGAIVLTAAENPAWTITITPDP